MLAPKGDAASKPDVAIVVFGEPPYAEFVGDRKDLAFRDEEGLSLRKAYRARGIKTVAVYSTAGATRTVELCAVAARVGNT